MSSKASMLGTSRLPYFGLCFAGAGCLALGPMVIMACTVIGTIAAAAAAAAAAACCFGKHVVQHVLQHCFSFSILG